MMVTALQSDTMRANTCAMPSASFAALPDLKADATGRATATGSVLFHGTENVALATMADGEHIIAIRAGGHPNIKKGNSERFFFFDCFPDDTNGLVALTAAVNIINSGRFSL